MTGETGERVVIMSQHLTTYPLLQFTRLSPKRVAVVFDQHYLLAKITHLLEFLITITGNHDQTKMLLKSDSKNENLCVQVFKKYTLHRLY